ncbi:hypothetical protein L1887_57645 [Cichorium endivia]|nr:hypothetical protein L1887_57645 [Cichorium endivia]
MTPCSAVPALSLVLDGASPCSAGAPGAQDDGGPRRASAAALAGPKALLALTPASIVSVWCLGDFITALKQAPPPPFLHSPEPSPGDLVPSIAMPVRELINSVPNRTLVAHGPLPAQLTADRPGARPAPAAAARNAGVWAGCLFSEVRKAQRKHIEQNSRGAPRAWRRAVRRMSSAASPPHPALFAAGLLHMFATAGRGVALRAPPKHL